MRRSGCWPQRRPGRSTSSSAPGWTCCAPRSRIPQNRGSDAPALLLRAAKTLEPLDPRLARETYLDAWSAALFAGRLASAGSLLEVSRAAGPRPGRPTRRARPICCSTASRCCSPTDAPQRPRPASGQRPRFAGNEVCDRGGAPLGMARDSGRVIVWDYETCVAVATRGVQLARDSGALAVLAVAVNVLAQAVALGGDFGTAASLIAEADAVTEATGTRVAPYGALVLAGFRGPRGRGLRADRRHHQGGHAPGPGNRGPVRALGQLGRLSTASAATRRRWRRPRRRATTRPSCSSPPGR